LIPYPSAFLITLNEKAIVTFAIVTVENQHKKEAFEREAEK